MTRPRRIQLLYVLCAPAMLRATIMHAQTLEWIQRFGATGALVYDQGEGVSADGLGNVYMTGYTFGSLEGSNAGYTDAFLTKFDALGNLVWVRQLGAAGADPSHTVSADKLGNVFIAGLTSRSSDNPLISIGGPIVGAELDAYFAKYDASGNLHWARKIGTTERDQAWAASADGLGSVYVAGETSGNLAAPNGGGVDAFLGKYDAEGNLTWMRQLGGSGYDWGEGVFSDTFGNAYVAGRR